MGKSVPAWSAFGDFRTTWSKPSHFIIIRVEKVFPARRFQLLHAANLLAHGNDQRAGSAAIPGMDGECFGAPRIFERRLQWQACVSPAARVC